MSPSARLHCALRVLLGILHLYTSCWCNGDIQMVVTTPHGYKPDCMKGKVV